MKLQIYRDALKEFRWHMVAKGRIIAESGEGYKRHSDLQKVLDAFIDRICFANYTIEDSTGHKSKNKLPRKVKR